MPRICVAIQAKTMEQTIESILKSGLADLIEVRLDYRTEPLSLSSIREATDKPLIATNRRRDQGGRAMEPESKRIQLLFQAVEAGFDYVDIASTTESLEKTHNQFVDRGVKTIISYHDFKNPLNMETLVEKHLELSRNGCALIKLVGWTNNYLDNIPYLEYNKAYPGNISFGMGEYGVISRILSPLSGAAYTYASLDPGSELAAGQIPLQLLWETYRSIRM